MKAEKRLLYLDYAKGVAIICMLYDHTMNLGDYYSEIWITSWFMPVFFVICGIILGRRFGGGIAFSDILRTVKKRLFQLGIPYIVFCFLLTAFYYILSLIGHEPFDFLNYIVRIITLKGIDSLWFIPCFFIVELLFSLTLMTRGKIGIFIRMLISVSGMICIIFSIQFPHVIEIECFLFVYYGYIASKYGWIEKCPIGLSIIMLAIGMPMAIINGAVGLAAGIFHNGYLFIANALITSTSIISFFCFMERKNIKLTFLEFFGKNTIVVLCTNNLLIEFVRLLDSKLTGKWLLNSGIWGSIVFTLILVALEMGIIRVSKMRYVSWLFGKRQKATN